MFDALLWLYLQSTRGPGDLVDFVDCAIQTYNKIENHTKNTTLSFGAALFHIE